MAWNRITSPSALFANRVLKYSQMPSSKATAGRNWPQSPRKRPQIIALSPSGETNNGDNLICIQDPRVATSYAIQALLIFDHLHFAVSLHTAKNLPTKAATEKALTLQKPIALSGLAKSWFDSYYVSGSQAERDRLLFSH